MKNKMRKLFAVFLVLIVAFIIWIVWLSEKGKQQQSSFVSTTNVLENKSDAPTATKTNQMLQTNFPITGLSRIINDREKTNEIRQYLESENKPIDLYAQVIDQNGDSVSGVKINGRVLHLKVIVPAAWGSQDELIPFEKETDMNGRFEINNVAGRALEIESIQKDGYLLSTKAPHGFSPGTGSLEHPAIIRMWKESAKEPLISGSHVYGMDSGKVYTLDLVSGKKIGGEADGDLRVTITRPPDANPREKFPWSFSIEALGGGLVEADPTDEFLYFAPESGYEPKLQMQFDADDPSWVGIVKRQFFIRSRNGQVYGRAQIEVDSIYNIHCAIQIDYAINPNSSRNLKP